MVDMYNVLIVEDEEAEADRLKQLLHRYEERKNVQFQITWHSSSMAMLSDKKNYDLYFLDIELPGITGMEAAELLRTYNQQSAVIFVTNLAKYAVRGYEVGASGFIVKPAIYGNLSINLDRAIRTIGQSAKRSVIVPTDDGMRVIGLQDIVFVEVFGHKLQYHLDDGSLLEARGSLGQLEEELSDGPVVRVSKHCLANMDKISMIKPTHLQMSTGDELYFSRSKKREVVDTVTDYLGGRR